MYKIEISNKAIKDFNNLPDEIFQRIDKKIELLKEEPRLIGSIKLSEEEGFRVRVGQYRILYRIDDVNKLIVIYKIGHRKEVYRKK